MKFKNLLYSCACLSFAIVIGGAVYEHLAVVPQWAAAPPHSLSMFQGEYGLNAKAFWIPIHPFTLLLMITTLLVFWKTEKRKNILVTLAGYGSILIITNFYFVPELLDITGTAFSTESDNSLTERAKLWEMLSLVRLAFLLVLAITLFLGMSVPERSATHPKSQEARKRPTATLA